MECLTASRWRCFKTMLLIGIVTVMGITYGILDRWRCFKTMLLIGIVTVMGITYGILDSNHTLLSGDSWNFGSLVGRIGTDSSINETVRYHIARYNVDRVAKGFLSNLQAELNNIKMKSNIHQNVTNLLNEIIHLSVDRSTMKTEPNITDGTPYRTFTVMRQKIYDKLTLVNQRLTPSYPGLQRLIDDSVTIERLLKPDVEILSHPIKEPEDWKRILSSQLAHLVQNRINALQNPDDCSQSKLVYCKYGRHCARGFGCQIHHLTHCLMTAYALNRTLVFDTRNWPFPGPFDTWFQPLTSCTNYSGLVPKWTASGTDRDLNSRIVEVVWPGLSPLKGKHMPVNIPKDVGERLLLFHQSPLTWWIGQFVHYVLRPNQGLEKVLDKYASDIGFKYPVVGIQVRRTDKLIREAKAIELSKYIAAADKWYSDVGLTSRNVTKRIFIATDEPKVIKEALEQYKGYEFLHSHSIVNVNVNSRTSKDGWRSIIFDLLLLARANHTVCTFSSNICRTVYEMMHFSIGHATDHVTSLDHAYSIGEMGRDSGTGLLVMAHNTSGPNVAISDEILKMQEYRNGTSSGILRRTGQRVTIPTYKIKRAFN